MNRHPSSTGERVPVCTQSYAGADRVAPFLPRAPHAARCSAARSRDNMTSKPNDAGRGFRLAISFKALSAASLDAEAARHSVRMGQQ
jgi:hypothetical protein